MDVGTVKQTKMVVGTVKIYQMDIDTVKQPPPEVPEVRGVVAPRSPRTLSGSVDVGTVKQI